MVFFGDWTFNLSTLTLLSNGRLFANITRLSEVIFFNGTAGGETETKF
jgi:hypothetical protein